MKKTLKKIVCGVLAISLCLSNVNMTAFSADTENGDSSTYETETYEESEEIVSEKTDEPTDLMDAGEEDNTVAGGSEEEIIIENDGDFQIPEETGEQEFFMEQETEAASETETETEIGTETETETSDEMCQGPVNRIDETEQIGMELSDWWYLDSEGNRQDIGTEMQFEENRRVVVCDLSKMGEGVFSDAGFDLSFTFRKEGQDRSVCAGDYLSFTLPGCFENLSVTGADEEYYTYSLEKCQDGSWQMMITFGQIPEDENLTGKIHLTYSLADVIARAAGSTCSFVLQEKEYQVEFPREAVTERETILETESKTVPETETEAFTETETTLETEGETTPETETETEQVTETFTETETETEPESFQEEGMTLFSVREATAENTEENNNLAQVVEQEKISISGSLKFDEVVDGIDWKAFLRPLEFDQPIEVIQKFTDSEGTEHEITIPVQDNISQADFYLKFVHDGEGGGDFTIENVPKTVNVGEGTYPVVSYTVKVSPTLPYYQSGSFAVPISSGVVASTDTLELTVKSQSVTVKPGVDPAEGAGDPSFTMNLSFTNPKTLMVEKPEGKSVSVDVSVSGQKNMLVPVGMEYIVTQTSKSGFALESNYQVTTTAGEGQESGVTLTENCAKGVVRENVDVTINTMNYAQNKTAGFHVNWVDNQRTDRPALTAGNFILKYSTDGTTWVELTNDKLAELGIANMPGFDDSDKEAGNYYFTGLPAKNANHEMLQYQVEVNRQKVPEQYTVSVETGSSTQTFTFSEETAFQANIVWNDISKADQRPESISGLKLYRRVDNGAYELVLNEIPDTCITKSADGNTWNIKIEDIPRYNSSDREYDYVLVQGSIENGTTVTTVPLDKYKIYYNNGTGNYSHDDTVCHNNGKITEVLYETVDFQARKEWRDPTGTTKNRPASVVTLWRYIKGEANGINDAYANGKAAQVIVQSTVNNEKKETLMSYQLASSDNVNIVFNKSNISDLPDNYQLPKYDDQGKEYVYFVRETLSGNTADQYEIRYEDQSEETAALSLNGAPNGGKIVNVRREKAKVVVKKVWKNPANLSGITGTTVQLEISAKTSNDETMKPLTVYSSQANSYEVLTEDEKAEAEKTPEFGAGISSAEAVYYVNIFDENGYPYDMENACISETVIGKDSENNEWNAEPSDEIITLRNGDTYRINTEYITQLNNINGEKEYHYQQTNTITKNRTYTLEKVWDTSISADKYNDIVAVNFHLKRRSTKDHTQGYVNINDENGVAKVFSVPKGEGTNWSAIISDLPKYDEDGYEYEYIATEVNLTKEENGTTITNGTNGWSVNYFRTPEGTKALNYVSGQGGSGYFTVEKKWNDNGDTTNRNDIKIRIYERADLLSQLSTQKGDNSKADGDFVDIKALTKYREKTITSSNDYQVNVDFNELKQNTGSTSSNWKDYVVIEYAVGDNPASYTYEQLIAAATKNDSDPRYSISGTVESSNRKYRTDISFVEGSDSGQILIENTRIGETEIHATKTWLDDHNASGNRPDSVQFQLYQDGMRYTDIPDSVEVQVTGAELDKHTGIITVTKNSNNKDATWAFTISGLPMFSELAAPHSYDLEEQKISISGNNSVDYIQEKGSEQVISTGTSQNYTFSFTNTITGKTEHVAYKYWKDAGIGSEHRPDLYMTLYSRHKSNKNEAFSIYTGDVDQIWTQEPTDTTGTEYQNDYVHGYNWKIVVQDLPRFDAEGHEYEYQFQERMSNNGVTVIGTYLSDSKTDPISGTGAHAGETYEVFTNTISDYMTIQGSKIWTGLDRYRTGDEDLPDPLITLYRTIHPLDKNIQDYTENELAALTEVDSTYLTGPATEGGNSGNESSTSNPKTRYFFPASAEAKPGLIINVDGKLMLPKFDSDGNRYTYLVRESFLDESIEEQLYTETNNNGTLTNVFREDVNRRKITVTKTWDGREKLPKEEQEYPSVTYRLYRYEYGKESSTAIELKTHKINAQQFENAENGVVSYTFDDLLVYSPKGVQYCYYVVEDSINGYSTTYQNPDNSTPAANRIDVTDVPDGWNQENADNNVNVGTTNEYNPEEKITITGTKIWKDYSDCVGIRPDSIAITLSRHAANETGQVNAVEDHPITLETEPSDNKPYIVWENTDSDSWKYTIYNLELYAPNGKPYIYTVSETPVDGYKQAASVAATAKSGIVTMPVMTNYFDGTYYVRKNWMDGNNKYNFRPRSITVVLQWSKDGGATWENMPLYAGEPSLPTVMKENEKDIVSVTLTSEHVKPNTKNNSWQYTFQNLPTKCKENGETKNIIYRCEEVAIGGVDIEPKTTEEGKTTYTAGAYERNYTIRDNEKTVIENTLKSTSLVVNKLWDDQDNKYQSRPESLTFVLQKRGIMISNDENESMESKSESGTQTGTVAEEGQLSEWQDVMLTETEPYTFTISASNGWTTTLEDLPVAEVVTDPNSGKKYTVYSLYFRAVEKHVDNNSKIVYGAQNYEDKTNYATGTEQSLNPDHYYDDQGYYNVSNISNSLRLDEPPKSVSVKKIWKRVSGYSVEAIFELQYRIKNSENSGEWKSFDTPLLYKVNSTASGESAEFVWKYLPQFDREGNVLEYQIIEHPMDGYQMAKMETEETEETYTIPETGGGETQSVTSKVTKYQFINIELQDYTVEKIWQTTDYAQKTEKGYTAEFQLQKRIADGSENQDTWINEGDPVTLTMPSSESSTSITHTWRNLPRYTVEGKEISYRAVETKINNINVQNNTNGDYIVSYQYADKYGNTKTTDGFTDSKTIATNRMIYGFVNLSKKAAYLAPGITMGTGSLKDVTFDIYVGTDTSSETGVKYVTGVKTDEQGNLIYDAGKYGTEGKYLIPGTYTIKESSANDDFSVWADGVTFKIGTGQKDTSGTLQDTGEHGTAWITTNGAGAETLGLKVEYKESTTASGHSFADTCVPFTNDDAAVNLESRGVLSFTKTGPNSGILDTHIGASGESSAYFGVYLDEACTQQVAGMTVKSDSEKEIMVLTNKAQDGSELSEMKNDRKIPYLRAYGNSSYPQYPFTLLTGTYYIKELTAPAGYKLDTAVRKAVVEKIESTALNEDLSGVYPGNKAQIMLLAEKSGSTDYQWSNDPNVVTLYKRDQYGRPVTLKDGGYLELRIAENGKTFPSGEDTIRLYQNAEKPATKNQENGEKVSNITYGNGAWTITGLFDIKTSYTLSEPDSSVPVNNITANPISFTMGADGQITVTSPVTETVEKDDPLSVKGDDYVNYYKPDAAGNILVMRDVARYLKDVALEKKDSDTQAAIPNISFELYKYEGKGENGVLTDVEPVLAKGTYLTTDSKGEFVLSGQDESVINQITNCALKYGLDVGKYYFHEVERGASDRYRLVDDIFFEITPKEGGTENDYSDYAKVTFDTTNSHVSQDPIDGKTGTVTNDPVTMNPKTLVLTKTDSANPDIKLANARFILSYQSITQGQNGSVNTATYKCITNSDGVLYLANDDWNLIENQPDISQKGSYVLKEVQAPDTYMTRTEDGTDIVVTMVTFDVNSSNQITNVRHYDGAGNLVEDSIISNETTKEHTSLNLTVKNEKTIVSVAKRNDIESSGTGDSAKTDTKTCDQKSLNGEPLPGATLEIYEGTDITAADKRKDTLNENSDWTLAAGTLKENTVYTLHESQTPVGYLPADDIYFKLFGTTTKDNRIVSQLYVWNGSGKPGTVDGTDWLKNANLKDNVLTMVDEAVIAPVDMQKVVRKESSYEVLPGAEFEVKEGEKKLGTAISAKNGYLVWKEITKDGYASGLIFNADGKRIRSSKTGSVAAEDSASVIGHTIILQQNGSGYTFTETFAPDHAYNEGESFTVKITAKNYTDYKSDTGYHTNSYIDILAASNTAENTVDDLSVRNDTNDSASNTDLVNPPFEAKFQLYKYDAEHWEINEAHNNYDKIGLEGVIFTLSKKQADGSYKTVGDYTTGEQGLLFIPITEKGTYHLEEKTARTGYEPNTKVMEFTIVNGDYQKTLTYSEASENTSHTTIVKEEDGTSVQGVTVYDLPNYRIHGSVTLTKVDVANANIKLNGVKYILTRTSPDVNSLVDRYFPSSSVQTLTVETGKTYSNIAAAENQDGITVTDGATGVLTLEDLQWGTYTLVETEANDRYVLDDSKTLTFTIGPNNLNEKVKDGESEFIGNNKNQITFIKNATSDSDKLNGATSDSDKLNGAKFKLFKIDETGKIVADNPADFYENAGDVNPVTGDAREFTLTNGENTLYGLAIGDYVLRETLAPEGYELAQDVRFCIDKKGLVSNVTACTVEEDGTVQENSGNTPSVVMQDTVDGRRLTIKDEPIEVSLKKVDADGPNQGLAGAVYEIIGLKFAQKALSAVEASSKKTENGITTITLKQTNEYGIIAIPSALLVAGQNYRIHEVSAPDSFELGEDVTISVADDGTVSISDTFAIANTVMLKKDGTEGGEGAKIVGVRLQDTPISVSIRKSFEGAAEIPRDLEGAVFSITPKEESRFADTVIGKQATDSGYVQEGIKGQYNQESNVVYLQVNVDEKSGTTPGTGSLAIPKGLLKQGECYILTEIKTSDGYQWEEATNSIEFTVGADGTVTFTERTDRNSYNTTFTGTGTDEISVSNKRTEFLVQKVCDKTTSEYDLSGVKLTLTRVNSAGTEIDGTAESWTNASAEHTWKGLTAGWYMLEESLRPKGYLQAAPIYFKLNQDNKVELAALRDGKLEVSTGENAEGSVNQKEGTNKYLITMDNTLIRGHVAFTKRFSGNDSAVQDAVFSLYKKTSSRDILIAEGLRTDENGHWTTLNNTTDRFVEAGRELEGAGENDTLSIGLTAGTYYFKETSCDVAYLPQDVLDKEYEFTIQDASDEIDKTISDKNNASNDYPTTKREVIASETDKASITNTPYTASFQIWKTEVAAKYSYAYISDAIFEIWYSGSFDLNSNGEHVYSKIGQVKTGAGGLASYIVSKKGWYFIKEISNAGYDVSDVYYCFELKDEHYSKIWNLKQKKDTNQTGTLYLKKDSDTTCISNAKINTLEVSSNNYSGGDGIENNRRTINLKLTKADSANPDTLLAGVEFKLYSKEDIDTDGQPEENAKAVKQGTTDNHGVLTLQGLDWQKSGDGTNYGEYVLIETKANDGYHTRKNIEFTLTRDMFTDPNVTPVKEITANEAANEKMKLVIKKTDETGNIGLDGAVFAIYQADDVTVNPDGTYTIQDGAAAVENSLISGTDTNAEGTKVPGTVTLSGKLVGGTNYALVETTPPDGYKVSPPVYFHVDAKGMISAMGGTTPDSSATITSATFSGADGRYATDNMISVKDKKITALLYKKNLEGTKSLSGAVFKVSEVITEKGGQENYQIIEDDITINNGAIPDQLVGKLVAGKTYLFEETSAPKGYELMKAKVSVDIYGRISKVSLANGEVECVNPDGDTSTEGNPDSDPSTVHTGNSAVTFMDTPIAVTITKYDRETKEVIVNNPATYELRPASGSEFAMISTELEGLLGTNSNVSIHHEDNNTEITYLTLVTESNGSISIPSALLVAGKQYELTETVAPEGYELATYTLKFTVNEDGTLTLNYESGQSTDEYSLYQDDAAHIKAQDPKITIKINKKDSVNNKTSLSGAVFHVTGDFAGTVYDTKGMDVTVNDNGVIADLTGKLVAGKTYTFTETTPPQGYELDPQIVFSIRGSTDGTFTKVSGNDGIQVNAADQEMIDVPNIPVEITLKKVDQENTDTTLEGAEFTLKPFAGSKFSREDIENDTVTLVTGNDGTIAIESALLVINNTYVLTETKAPNGYELAGEITFKVASNGTIGTVERTANTDGSGTVETIDVSGEAVCIQITNKQIDAGIMKYGLVKGGSSNNNTGITGNADIPLAGVEFTLEPKSGSGFVKNPANSETVNGIVTVKLVTDANGKVEIEKGILVQKNTYILKEIATNSGYYLGNSAKAGVEIYVDEYGRLKVLNGIDEKNKEPYRIDAGSPETVIVTNPQSTGFTIKKDVTGNMGDLNGSFDIKVVVKEPDGTIVKNKDDSDSTTVTLKKDGTYVSTTDYTNGMPVGAIVEITEPEDLGYTAKVDSMDTGLAEIKENVNNNRGKVQVTLNPNKVPKTVPIKLTNHKDVAIDIGVDLEKQAPWAILSMILPTIWLTYRRRRKQRGGEC